MANVVILRQPTITWDSVVSVVAELRHEVLLATTPGEAMTGCAATSPPLLITPDAWDVRLLLEPLTRLRETAPRTRCVVLADRIEAQSRDAYAHVQLAAYVLLHSLTEPCLRHLISLALTTDAVTIDTHLFAAITQANVRAEPYNDATRMVTNRQRRVLQHLARGRARHEIAGELGVSARTVSREIESLHAVLGSVDPFTLAVQAQRHGIM